MPEAAQQNPSTPRKARQTDARVLSAGFYRPGDFKKMIDITYRFSSGWRRVHNPKTGHDAADDLMTTEFVIAMLAARDRTAQEIAEHLKISANTAKTHVSEAMRKLNVQNRKDLKQYMLL